MSPESYGIDTLSYHYFGMTAEQKQKLFTVFLARHKVDVTTAFDPHHHAKELCPSFSTSAMRASATAS